MSRFPAMQTHSAAYAQADDETLLQRVAQQDTLAYEVLYDRHATVVYSLLLRIVHQPAQAEELLQETFWQIWRSARGYRGEGAAVAWLLRIARNRALDELRRQKARPQVTEGTSAETVMAASAVEQVDRTVIETRPLEDTVIRRWNQEQVQLALVTIPIEQRICLELSYFEGFSQRQIADHLALPVGTVKSRMRIGMEKLEIQLRKIGFP